MKNLMPCHAGDVMDKRLVQLGGIVNLDAVQSIETHVRKGATTATLATQVFDSSERTVLINLGSAPGDWLPAGPEVGLWEGQVEAKFLDGSELTWPTDVKDGLFTIHVFPQFG